MTEFLFFVSVKYLGLLAMSRILKSHPKSVQTHKDLVLTCLDDKDESIRLRALGLLYGMVSWICFNYYKRYIAPLFIKRINLNSMVIQFSL